MHVNIQVEFDSDYRSVAERQRHRLIELLCEQSYLNAVQVSELLEGELSDGEE